MSDDADKIAALEAKVAALEAKSTPTPYDPRETERRIAEHRDRMRALSERRMDYVVHDWNVLDPATCQDLWQHGTVQSPSMAGASGQVTGVHPGGGAAVNTTGWVAPTPLSPPPGVQWVDAQMIADEVRQRAELKRKLGE